MFPKIYFTCIFDVDTQKKEMLLHFEWEERRQRINMHYTVYPQTAGEIFKVSGMHPFSQ